MVVENPRYALAVGVLFVFSPLTDWLSQVIVNLVTLRRGPQMGFRILLPVSIAAAVYGCFSISIVGSVLNTGLAFLPGYFAATLLRSKAQWRSPANGLILFCMLAAGFVHVFYPGFIAAQYAYMKSIFTALPNSHLFDLITLDEVVIANYVFGFQMAGIVLSTLFSLIIARRVQSDLFFPEGFKQEMLFFRAEKWVFCFFAAVIISAYQHNLMSINILPVLGLYFVISGLSVGFYIVSIKYVSQQKWANIVLLLSLFIVPWLFAPMYAVLGVIDCLINLRGYLPVRVGKTT